MPKLFTSTPAIFESWFVQKKGKKQDKGFALLSSLPFHLYLRFMFLFVLLLTGKKQGEGELEPEAAEVLHEILRPFFLRRTKEEVLKDLPPKTEVILYTGMPTFPLAVSFSLFCNTYILVQVCQRCRRSTTNGFSQRTPTHSLRPRKPLS